MCGIAGIITPNAENYREHLKRMTDSIAHRGPDAEGFEFFGNAALGHRRLSIVDLSESGAQPMFSASRKECIVFNGEIYGYQELKKKHGYPYKSSTDTEVILAMYKEKASEMLNELPGMFAFAIWDEARQELFCARDRFGEKPFYYAFGKNGEFIFASEIKAILASGLVQREISPDALYHFLKYGYVSAQQSIYKNISVIPPAHFLIFRDGKVSLKRYYSLPKNDGQISLAEAKEEFTHLLKNAVRKQMVADVEVGSFLSGGLDSSTIVAMVNEFLPKQTTISFGYEGERSELKFAREIADKYNTKHIEIHENRGDIAEEILRAAKFLDEPFSDMSYTPQFHISEAAARHLTVILAGDVGDELFGGYDFYRVEHQLRSHFSYRNIVAKFGLKLWSKFRTTSFITQKNLEYSSILDFHQNFVRNYFADSEIEALGINAKYRQAYSFTAHPDSLNDIMRTDLEKYVPGNMLVKSDRMAMANSLEVRTPFLDKEFAEFCISLPENLKIDGENDKIILREAVGEYWTEGIRQRRKQGFGSSVSAWLNTDSMKILSNEILGSKQNKVYDLVNYNAAQPFLNGGKQHWNLLQLGIWANKLISI